MISDQGRENFHQKLSKNCEQSELDRYSLVWQFTVGLGVQ